MPDLVAISSGRTSLRFDRTTLSLMEITDNQSGVQYLAQPAGSLFSITLTPPSGSPVVCTGADAVRRRIEERSDARQRTVRLRYERCPAPGGWLDVTIHATATQGDPIIRLGISVVNRSAVPLGICRFPLFPRLGSNRPDAAKSEYLVVPLGSGRKWAEPRSRAHAEEGYLEYPSSGCSLQMMVYCGGEDAGGLYLAAEDGSVHRKCFCTVPHPDDHAFEWRITHYPSGVKPGRAWRLPYPVALAALQRDWYEAARYYRTAIIRRKRLPHLSRRTDIPTWFLHTHVWLQGQDEAPERDRMQRHVAYLKALRQRLDQPFGFHWYLWQKGRTHDTRYPDFFPAAPGFADAIAALRQSGVYAMPYINVELFDTMTEMWTKDQAERWASRKPDGTLHKVIWQETPEGPRMVNMCPGTSYWRELMARTIARLAVDYGADAVYLDELHVYPYPCHARNHEHADIGGDYFGRGYRTMIQMANRQLHSQRREPLALTCEQFSDAYADSVAGQLAWSDIHPDMVPMFQSAIKDRTIEFGLMMVRPEIEHMPSFAAKMGRCFCLGRQLGWINFHQADLMKPALDQQVDMLRRLSRCRAQHMKYLVYGDFLRPPDLRSGGHHTVPWSQYPYESYDPAPVQMPRVMGAAYRAPSGELGLVLCNTTDTAVTVNVPVEIADWSLTPDVPYRRTDWMDGRTGTTTSVDVTQGLRMTIPAYTPAVLELKRHRRV